MKTIRLVVFAALAACGSRPPTNALIPQSDSAVARDGLSAAESQLLQKHGFVISERGQVTSFHAGYTALFHDHQPVYVTADSLLYAWHSSYDQILMDLETTQLIPKLGAMLTELRRRLADSKADAQTRADLDVYLTVAASLAAGKPLPPVAGGDAAVIAQLYQSGESAQGDSLTLFGTDRGFDFSMLKPRGHYELWPELQQYFRAMSWLGRVELEIAYKRKPSEPWTVDRRALRAATLLAQLYPGEPREHWNTLDTTIESFVGPRDSMSLDGLAAGLAKLGNNPNAPDADVVAAFAAPSTQQIRTQLAHAGSDSRAFVLLGQRFVFDSKVFSDLTYGSLETKTPRLMPSPLDVGYAVLRNPAAGRLLDDERKKFGEPYKRALEAAATAPRDPKLWNASLYHGWLGALRELSPDAKRDAAMPAPLTSDAWSRRMLATQLASWAELRHDNLLYAKQSFTGEIACEYPDGYVEPYPAFFAAMQDLAKRGRATVDRLKLASNAQLVKYFDKMADTMGRLHAIAERERANHELLPSDLEFLNHMVSVDGRGGGCGGPTTEPGGWYADLFYDRSKILSHEPVIADVHTQPSDEAGNRVGRVLHVGTRAPRLFVARLEHDGGKHAQTYRGFMSTYAETITHNFKRYTDEEWQTEANTIDSTPAWMQSIIAR
jgi:hypothetical protein